MIFKDLKTRLLIVFLLSFGWAGAQQDAYYANFAFNKLHFNPGYGGMQSRDKICATAIHKSQWMGFPGAVQFQNITLNSPMGKKSGIGLTIENDQIGFEANLNAQVNYAYQLKLANQQVLSLGASAGFIQKSLKKGLKSLRELQGLGADPNVPTSDVSGLKPDVSLGVYYTRQNISRFYNFFAGASLRHILPGTIEYQGSGQSGLIKNKIVPHMYLTAGGEMQMGSNVLIPSVIFRYDLRKWQFDFNANYLMKNKYWVGASFRNDWFTRADALVLLAGYIFNPSLKVGYSYDFTVSRIGPLRGNSSGSHEICISYCFGFKTTTKPIIPLRDTRRLEGWDR